MTRRVIRLAHVAALLSLFRADIAFTQPDSCITPEPQWNGMGVSEGGYSGCDLAVALQEHAKYSDGFASKWATNTYRRFSDNPSQAYKAMTYLRLRDLGTTALVDAVRQRLVGLSQPGNETKALIYGVVGNPLRPTVCVWVIDKAGNVTDDSRQLGNVPPSGMIQTALVIKERSAVRAWRSKPNCPAPTRISKPELEERLKRAPAAIAEVGDALLPFNVARALEGADRLIVLPSADIGAVPFGAIPWGGNEKLGKRFAVVVLPDIGALVPSVVADLPNVGVETNERTFRYDPPRDPSDLLVVANPTLNDPGVNFENLPEARAEGKLAFTSLMPGADISQSDSFLADANATYGNVETRLVRNQDNLRVVYFATHGYVNPFHPFDDTFLALRDGHLKGRAIKELNLSQTHPLVVMSACQSGLGRIFDGGVFGLARTWYYAGAGQVVGSLWNVSDKETRELMTAFVAHLAKGESPEYAMRSAIQDNPYVAGNDAALWAGFSVFGNPSEKRTWYGLPRTPSSGAP